MEEIGFRRHDHAACREDAMRAAETACAARGLRLTESRRRILEILLQEHKAMGAYDILGLLTREGYGAQPPLVYRALDFLVEHGFAHKIERLNAYIACMHPGDDHAPVFLICRKCGKVAETSMPMKSGLGAAASAVGFQIESTVIEAEGLCPTCREGSPQ